VPGRYRLVIREYETWHVDPAQAFRGLIDRVERTNAETLAPAVAPVQQVGIVASNSTRVESNDRAFALTSRALERIEAAIVAPTGRRLVYAEMIAVEPPAGSRDFSRAVPGADGGIDGGVGGPAGSVGGPGGPVGGPGGPVGGPGGPVGGPGGPVGGPGGPVVGGPNAPPVDGDPGDEPFRFAPQPGEPSIAFQPRWEEVPVVGPEMNPLIVSGALKLAQSMLNTAVSPQPPLAIDGIFSPLVELAIRALRLAVQLPDDGRLNLQGWLALASAAPFPVLEPGLGGPPMAGPPVALVQRLLNMTVNVGQVIEDGVFTPETANRVQAFQTDSGLPATGVVDRATWLEMATLIDLLQPVGAERVVLGFNRTRSEGGGPALLLISRDPLQDVALPPSDPVDADLSSQAGLRVELQDSRGLPLFRKTLGHLLSLPDEVVVDGETGATMGRPGAPVEETTLSFVLPVNLAATRLVVFGNIDPNDQGPAAPIAVFDPF
jgi:peptidoglycan hydrolase-like protein with peptidoglycan-binding domain